MKQKALLFVFFSLSINSLFSQNVIMIHDENVKNQLAFNKGSRLSPLNVISYDLSKNEQVVQIQFDKRLKIKLEYNDERTRTILSENVLDATNEINSFKEGFLNIKIVKTSKNGYKIIPDVNYNNSFSDDKIYNYNMIKDDRIPFFINYSITYWKNDSVNSNLRLAIIPDATTLPKLNKNILFNTWGGVQQVKGGKIIVGIDTFYILITKLSGSLDYNKNNISVSISGINEKYIDYMGAGNPLYKYGDTITLGRKLLLLDNISTNGDTVYFLLLDNKNMNSSTQIGGEVKEIYGMNIIDGRFFEAKLKNETIEYTLLHFWGSWCAPCIANLPELQSLIKNNNKIQVFGLVSSPKNSTV